MSVLLQAEALVWDGPSVARLAHRRCHLVVVTVAEDSETWLEHAIQNALNFNEHH